MKGDTTDLVDAEGAHMAEVGEWVALHGGPEPIGSTLGNVSSATAEVLQHNKPERRRFERRMERTSISG